MVNQTRHMTKEQKIDLYLTMSKRRLAEMLAASNSEPARIVGLDGVKRHTLNPPWRILDLKQRWKGSQIDDRSVA